MISNGGPVEVGYSTPTAKSITGSPIRQSATALYVGTPADYQKYEGLRLLQQTVEREESIAAMDENAALQEQSDFMVWRMW
jgi:hypothetical protein